MRDLIWRGAEVQKVKDKNGVVREYTVTRVQRVRPNKYSKRFNEILAKVAEADAAKREKEATTTGKSGAIVLGATTEA